MKNRLYERRKTTIKTEEELAELKEEVKNLNEKLKELSEEELKEVTGGCFPAFPAFP